MATEPMISADASPAALGFPWTPTRFARP